MEFPIIGARCVTELLGSEEEGEGEFGAMEEWMGGLQATSSSVSEEDHAAVERPPELVNVVAEIDVGVKLNLSFIASNFHNVQYNPKKWDAVFMGVSRYNCKAVISSTGKVIVVGCKSVVVAKRALRYVASWIKKYYKDVKYTNFKIHNMVASASLPYRVNLALLKARLTTDQVTTCGSQFPCVGFNSKTNSGDKARVIVFSTGTVTFLGVKQEQSISELFQTVRMELLSCRYSDY